MSMSISPVAVRLALRTLFVRAISEHSWGVAVESAVVPLSPREAHSVAHCSESAIASIEMRPSDSTHKTRPATPGASRPRRASETKMGRNTVTWKIVAQTTELFLWGGR